MPSVYKKTYTRPIPPEAEIITRRRGKGEGEQFARFKGRNGRTRTVPLTSDGTKILLAYRKYTIDYTGPDGRRMTVPGFPDYEASEQKGRDLERSAARARVGLEVADPGKALTPFSEVLSAWLADLERAGRDDMYRYNMRKLMEKLAAEIGWSTLASIQAGPMASWLQAARRKDKSPRTLNQYLETARAFVNWCVKRHYLEGNPLTRIDKAETSDKRRNRRALTLDELQRLLKIAGRHRLLYLTAAYTGLRKDELRKLEWGDLDLDAPQPCVRLRAPATKARRDEVLPLHPSLVVELRAARPSDAAPQARVFTRLPKWATYKKHVERAGIEYYVSRGQADFHALRKTFGTMLQRAGVPMRQAMALMRHTDIKLTANIYTDSALLDTAGEVAKIAWTSAP